MSDDSSKGRSSGMIAVGNGSLRDIDLEHAPSDGSPLGANASNGDAADSSPLANDSPSGQGTPQRMTAPQVAGILAVDMQTTMRATRRPRIIPGTRTRRS